MLHESHAPNPANKHSEWYAANFPKKDSGKCNLDLYVDTYWMYCVKQFSTRLSEVNSWALWGVEHAEHAGNMGLGR